MNARNYELSKTGPTAYAVRLGSVLVGFISHGRSADFWTLTDVNGVNLAQFEGTRDEAADVLWSRVWAERAR